MNFLSMWAANDPETSVSQAFENLGWLGIIVERLPEPAAKLRAVWCNPVVEAACTSPQGATLQHAALHIARHGGQQSLLDWQAQDALSKTTQSISVSATTLDAEIEKHALPEIDFLAIDVEGHELEVLAEFDFKRYRPKLVLLEDWARDFKRHRWMRQLRYKLVRRTGFNSWYVPAETALPVSAWGVLQLVRK